MCPIYIGVLYKNTYIYIYIIGVLYIGILYIQVSERMLVSGIDEVLVRCRDMTMSWSGLGLASGHGLERACRETTMSPHRDDHVPSEMTMSPHGDDHVPSRR